MSAYGTGASPWMELQGRPAYALGTLVMYRPEWTPPEAVDGWLPTPFQIVAIRTYAHIERPLQRHYTVMPAPALDADPGTGDADAWWPATGDADAWWHLRPIALVRAEQLRPYPPARCIDCGICLEPRASASTACAECATWARHLQPQEAR